MVEILVVASVVYLVGAILLLERRCLGQMALVQPLVLCVVAGWLAGRIELGLWCGISLQLFSLSPGRRVDWALAGVITAAVIVLGQRLEIPLQVGGDGACAIIALAALAGIGSRKIEVRYAEVDGARILERPPWEAEDCLGGIERIVHRRVVRWFLLGGVEVLVSVAVVTGLVLFVSTTFSVSVSALSVGAIAVPALGSAVAIAALGSYKHIAWAGLVAVAGAMIAGGL